VDFAKLIDADKVGGWVRAGSASLLATIVAKNPVLSAYLDPVTQAALATALSGIAVGIWSQLSKSDAAKIQMAAEVPSSPSVDVAKVEMAAAIPSVTKIVTTDQALDKAVTAPEVQLASSLI
jgi:hypothetical protein